MPILDPRGKPVSTKDLRKDGAPPARTGPRRWSHPGVATGMTPRRLAALFKAADDGDNVSLLTLAAEIERRDSHIPAQLATRKLAVQGLEWVAEAATDDKRDVDIAEELQAIIDDDIWSDLVGNSLDGIMKGYAVSEIMWQTGPRWTPSAFIWRDQRSFAVDLEDGSTLRIRTDAQPTTGEDMPPWKFVVHTPSQVCGPVVTRGLMRPLAVLYVLKTQGVRAWLTFMELFGIPLRLGKYPDGTSEDNIDKLWEALVAIGEDGAGVMPMGMSIQILDAIGKGGGGSAAHQALADWCDAQASKIIVGQTMTADNGSSLSQAKVHNEVRRDYVVADARALAATFRRDFVIPWCRINFGELAAYPRVHAQTDEPEDRKTFVDSLAVVVDRGFEVEASVVADRLGLPVPEPGAKILSPLRPPATAGAGPGKPGDSQDPAEPDANPSEDNSEGPAAPPAAKATRQARLAAADGGGDFIDDEAPPIDWATTMEPVRRAVKAAADGASSFDDFLARLAARSADVTELVESLALKTLQARGMGDATDEVG